MKQDGVVRRGAAYSTLIYLDLSMDFLRHSCVLAIVFILSCRVFCVSMHATVSSY